MKRRPIILGAPHLLFALCFCGCELVLGDLPTPKEDLSTSSTTAMSGTGGIHITGGAGAGGGTGGLGGAGAAGGMGGTAGASTAGSGGVPATTTTTGGEGGCCDCDGDNQDAVGLCGGMDCDDGDKKAYAGQPVYYTTPSPTQGFDWDCNGVPEPDPALTEPVQCGLIGLPCDKAKTGFLGNTVPACGEAGNWGTCKGTLLPCTEQIIEVGKKMACK